MPVSKKRKKEGKPVQRSHPPPIEGQHEDHGATGPESPVRAAKPKNPFVGQQPGRRAAQRGR